MKFRALIFLIVCFWVNASAFAQLNRFGSLEPGIFHGSQPHIEKDYLELKEHGVKTILNFRSDETVERSRAQAEAFGFTFINVPLTTEKGPTDSDVKNIFSILETPANKPIYFHCRFGRDRTGLIASLYRVFKQGMSPSDAYEKWLSLGYNGNKVRAIDAYFEKATGYETPPQSLRRLKACESWFALGS